MSAPLTQTQLPMESILDINGKQTYLGNTFVLPSSGTSLTTTGEIPLMLISNPSGSSKSLFLMTRKLTTDNNNVLVRFYYNATPNVLGATTTPVNLRTGANTKSISNCYLTATITSNGTLLGILPATIYSIFSDVLFIVDPGTNFLVTGQQESAGTTTCIIENVWYEI